jgi:hypothetical protein
VPEQIELGAAVALALDQLHPVDLPLHRSGRPRQRECGVDRGAVRGNPAGQPRSWSWPALLGIAEPRVQRCPIPRPHQCPEPLQIAGRGPSGQAGPPAG